MAGRWRWGSSLLTGCWRRRTTSTWFGGRRPSSSPRLQIPSPVNLQILHSQHPRPIRVHCWCGCHRFSMSMSVCIRGIECLELFDGGRCVRRARVRARASAFTRFLVSPFSLVTGLFSIFSVSPAFTVAPVTLLSPVSPVSLLSMLSPVSPVSPGVPLPLYSHGLPMSRPVSLELRLPFLVESTALRIIWSQPESPL